MCKIHRNDGVQVDMCHDEVHYEVARNWRGCTTLKIDDNLSSGWVFFFNVKSRPCVTVGSPTNGTAGEGGHLNFLPGFRSESSHGDGCKGLKRSERRRKVRPIQRISPLLCDVICRRKCFTGRKQGCLRIAMIFLRDRETGSETKGVWWPEETSFKYNQELI